MPPRQLPAEQVAVVLMCGTRTEENAHRLRCVARHAKSEEHRQQLHEHASQLGELARNLRRLAWEL